MICINCYGRGLYTLYDEDGNNPMECPVCKGTGEATEEQEYEFLARADEKNFNRWCARRLLDMQKRFWWRNQRSIK